MSNAVISIIDDDTSMREAAKGLLQSFGYAVTAFAAADDFLVSGALATTSCLILDIQMPGLDGLDVQSCLRLMGRRVPIVFVTAYPDDRVRARAIERGAIAFLSKPFSADDLVAAVKTALGASVH